MNVFTMRIAQVSSGQCSEELLKVFGRDLDVDQEGCDLGVDQGGGDPGVDQEQDWEKNWLRDEKTNQERLRKTREGEWDRTSRIGKAARSLSSRYKKEAEQRRTVSTRKLPLPSRTWPSKEELLFGFPLCDN